MGGSTGGLTSTLMSHTRRRNRQIRYNAGMPRGPAIFALADDTTGALEVGAQFVSEGVPSLVTTNAQPDLAAHTAALVVDTRSRHLTPEEARARVFGAAAAASRLAIPFVYKKTDSTLRGNIASEFHALLAAFPERPLIYVPAYPKLGRVVVNGELYVDGRPLADTPFSSDRLNPSREGLIPKMLADGCDAPIRLAAGGAQLAEWLRENAAGSIFVCDGRTDADLAEAASAIASAPVPCLVAGTGGFAGYWVRSLGVSLRTEVCRPVARCCLVVNGSLHPASREQVRRAAETGAPVFYLGASMDDSETARALAAAAARGRPVLSSAETISGRPEEVAARMGSVIRRALNLAPVDGLVISGGDTVLAVLDALGAAVIEPRGELLPGIPVSLIRCGGRELALATKAGGFGPPGVLASIRKCLEEDA